MNSERTFDKERFALLLDRAKGDRSINQYANETGVSAAHISRFLRQLVDTSPTPETIAKLADKAWGEVTYKEMMVAAGHITAENNRVSEDSPRSRMEEARKIEQEFFQIVITHLMNSDFKWSMEKPGGRPSFPDFTIKLEDDKYKKWYFEFISIKGMRKIKIPPTYICDLFYAKLLTFKLTKTDKFTMVINNEAVFDYIFKRPPVNLRANLYVMLIDLESRTVVKEERLTEYE